MYVPLCCIGVQAQGVRGPDKPDDKQCFLCHLCCAQPRCALCLFVAQVCKPKEFAAQINLSMEHCWGIVRALVDMLLKLDDGKFLLIKDPNKDLLR